MTNNKSDNEEQAALMHVVAAVIPCPVEADPIDVPSDSLTILESSDEEASFHDPLVMEVHAVPEERVTRLPAGDVCSGKNESVYDTGKYCCHPLDGNRPVHASSSVTPSHASVTLLNAKHRHRIALWQNSDRNHNMQERVHFQQHTTRPSFDPLGLTLAASSEGDLKVESVDTASQHLPWAHSQVDVGDVLVSINHVSVRGLLPAIARDRLYEAVLRNTGDATTTTLVFSKVKTQSPGDDTYVVATTVEKGSPEAKLGFKLVGCSSAGTMYISEIKPTSSLAPSCMLHTRDTILAINGQTTESLLAQTTEDTTVTRQALRVMAESPRYVTLVTAKHSDAAVAVTATEGPATAGWFLQIASTQ